MKNLQNKSGSGAATITSNKVRFPAVCLSGPTRLTVKLVFSLLSFTLIDVDCLVGLIWAGFLKILLIFHASLEMASIEASLNVVMVFLCLSDLIGLVFSPCIT